MSFKEKDFQIEFSRSIHVHNRALNKDYVYHKISDMSLGQKPADCFILLDGSCKLMELKIHNKSTAWSFNKVEPHQKKALMNAELSGNEGYVIINIRIPSGRGTALKENWVAIFTSQHIHMLEEIAGRKSLTLKDIQAKANYLVIKRDGYWDLRDFLQGNSRIITS